MRYETERTAMENYQKSVFLLRMSMRNSGSNTLSALRHWTRYAEKVAEIDRKLTAL